MASHSLAVAVQCNYGIGTAHQCGHFTRNPLALCPDHTRNATLFTPGQVGMKVRAATVAAALGAGTKSWAHSAAAIGQQALAQAPKIEHDGAGVWVRGVFDAHTTSVHSDTQRLDFAQDKVSYQAPPSTFTRHGDDLYIRYGPGGSMEGNQVLATQLAKHRWAQICERTGAVDAGEGYDDLAEIAAQYTHSVPADERAVFAVNTSGELVLRVSKSAGEMKIVDRYVFFDRIEQHAGKVVRVGYHEAAGRTITTDQHTSTGAIPEEDSRQREDLLLNLRAMVALINTYRVDVDGQIVMPVGWSSAQS